MLPKSRRFDRLSFLHAKQSGRFYRHPVFPLVLSRSDLSPALLPRVSVVCSSKLAKSAVVRNRIKRIIFSCLADFSLSADLIIYPTRRVLNLTDAEICSQLTAFLSEISLR